MEGGLPKGSHPRPIESVLQPNYAVHRVLPSQSAYFEGHVRWLTLHLSASKSVNLSTERVPERRRPRQFEAVRAERDEEPVHSTHVLSAGFYAPIFIL